MNCCIVCGDIYDRPQLHQHREVCPGCEWRALVLGKRICIAPAHRGDRLLAFSGFALTEKGRPQGRCRVCMLIASRVSRGKMAKPEPTVIPRSEEQVMRDQEYGRRHRLAIGLIVGSSAHIPARRTGGSWGGE